MQAPQSFTAENHPQFVFRPLPWGGHVSDLKPTVTTGVQAFQYPFRLARNLIACENAGLPC